MGDDGAPFGPRRAVQTADLRAGGAGILEVRTSGKIVGWARARLHAVPTGARYGGHASLCPPYDATMLRSVSKCSLEGIELFQAGARLVAAHVVFGISEIFLGVLDGLGDRGGVDFLHRHNLLG